MCCAQAKILNLLRQSSDAVIVENTTPPMRCLTQLTIDGANNTADETIIMPSSSSIDKLTIVINMPSIILPTFEYDPTSAPPVANRIESVRDCIVDAPPVLDSVGEVSQGDIEGPVT
ncbi:hypothetical protein HG531_009706 [Fusarium graminearum]|nr:hypothetical protein HG531_009706 [Fusarium graminearum]